MTQQMQKSFLDDTWDYIEIKIALYFLLPTDTRVIMKLKCLWKDIDWKKILVHLPIEKVMVVCNITCIQVRETCVVVKHSLCGFIKKYYRMFCQLSYIWIENSDLRSMLQNGENIIVEFVFMAHLTVGQDEPLEHPFLR